MAAIDDLARFVLAPRDVVAASGLVAEARWNQTRDDWLLFMRAGTAIGLEDGDGRLVATAAVLPCGAEFGWISMVLVTRDWRRKGIATALLDACIAIHRDAGRVPVLDATPEGETVYRRLGFAGNRTLTRWQREGRPARPATAPPVARLDTDRLDDVVALDRSIFGGDRSSVIVDFATRHGSRAWQLADGAGFLLSRAGRRARQLGPLLAGDERSAVHILAAAIDATAEPLLVDVPDRHAAVAGLLEARGFTRQRPFRRMLQGPADGYGDAARMFAIAGPEFG